MTASDSGFLVPKEVWGLATDLDYGIAEMVRKDGCRHCGAGKLHISNYILKPRGIDGNGGNFLRLSFCCDQKSCRRRINPVSLRFRRQGVYANSFYEDVSSAMRAMTDTEFRKELGQTSISDRTLRRWKKNFVGTKSPGILKFFHDNASLDSSALLTKLLEDFGGDKKAFYEFLETISTETLVFLANQKDRDSA
ncbi:MAG: hypothetical protein OXI01_13445 [Albidovulum sp.]|nr:hypothetical protein [Albidovulum sp.]